MFILKLNQKQSNSGSIHDLESANYQREIKFRGNNQIAVVGASHYGDVQSSHKSKELALKMLNTLKKEGYSSQVIDRAGGLYVVGGYKNELCRV